MKELEEQLLALSADAYLTHQQRGDGFALRVADVTAGLALKVKALLAASRMPLPHLDPSSLKPSREQSLSQM